MSKFANIGASTVFLFLATLLIVSRFATETFHTPLIFFGFALLITLGIVTTMAGKKSLGQSLIALALFAAITLIWAFATIPFYDPGFDGYAYHLSAIWDIGEGWNPFFSPHNNIWVDSYPNGYWVLQSYIVSLTGLLMSGQALIVGLMAAVALLSYGFFLDSCAENIPRFPRIAALIFSGILVANPVVIGQLLTHYVDAPLYLFGVALALFLLSDAFRENRLARLSALCCIILMVNTKTAALYYTPLIVFAGFVAELTIQRADRDLLKRGLLWIRKKGLLFAFTFILGVTVIGFKPYVTNILDHGQLLYPSVSKIMKGNEPENVIPLSAPMKFVYGIFAQTDHSEWPIDAPIELKIPGTFQLSEFKYLRFDTRRGGFGPFFSLALLAAIAAFTIRRLAHRKHSRAISTRAEDGLALFGALMILASMFFPESWWARYVPFTWLSAILFIAAFIKLNHAKKWDFAARVLAFVALLSFLGCILASGLGAVRESRLLYARTEMIEKISLFPEVKLLMFYDPPAYRDFQSTSTQDGLAVWTRLLADRGLKTEISHERNQFDCDMAGYLNGGIYWCVIIDEMQ
ncbi:hypothetical protein J0X12_09395 [Sneathiella sp. CAU 1612]|uniref:Glycosyltransferase RgtA/B/C/D-like domain-containing protein n=1 Tax=Sneathiella sedimenti TaxID=2816034 RepID=A0ABS3F5P0_9PROT|nr:hypothetical protein [Sneathiella sedimenti]MBO0333828.1 hypothetical protein [Sneathiella sedimenti]